MNVHYISQNQLDLNQIENILENNLELKLSKESVENIQKCRDYLDKKIQESDKPIYGINTGFGSLYDRDISSENLEQLQTNLVMSHACGAGDEIPQQVVRLMLLLKIQSLSYGHSGVQLVTVQRLIDFFNKGIYPVVFEQGSLGASGDLAPLAHLCLPLIGHGEVIYEWKRYTSAEINTLFDWDIIHLQAKEGLALLNGTQFMSAFAANCLIEGKKLMSIADWVGAMSIDAFDGRIEPFNHLIHDIRGQVGQIETARAVKEILHDSEIVRQKKKHVQDPYSFRCIPQVHGASKDAIQYVESIVLREINGVTDNPNVFPDEDLIISGGNFHGQPLALSLDFLAIALAELGNISERRTYQLVSGLRELPEFLVAKAGLNSGLMIPQYTAASIVSQSKQLCTPASVDSIVSSNGQEDHVSMGANAATKALKVTSNTFSVLAIELITAAQALHFRSPLKTSSFLRKKLDNFRKEVPFIEIDRVLHDDIQKATDFLRNL